MRTHVHMHTHIHIHMFMMASLLSLVVFTRAIGMQRLAHFHHPVRPKMLVLVHMMLAFPMSLVWPLSTSNAADELKGG